LVQLDTGTKRKINEIFNGYPLDMNGVSTVEKLNITPLGSYDFIIGMDWLDLHHVVIDFHNKTFTCLDEERKQRIIKGIPRPIYKREISFLQVKICFRKGCQLYVAHVEYPIKCIILNLKEFPVLQEYVYIFGKILGLPGKIYIYFLY